jgi:hypothetical protein
LKILGDYFHIPGNAVSSGCKKGLLPKIVVNPQQFVGEIA